MKSLHNKKSDALTKRVKKIHQSTFIPKYKIKSIQKMKAKHRSRINDRIDEISDSINKLHGLLKELNSEHGNSYLSELEEDLGFEEKGIYIEDPVSARYRLQNFRLGMLVQILFRCQQYFDTNDKFKESSD